jgi:nickel/cobalt transporter (NiCoT) family protein
MLNSVSNLFSDEAAGLRARVIGASVLLVGANIAAWLWALSAFRNYPILLGTAMLAYTFGLRHAFDVDHIAAIDNVTRKLMQGEATCSGRLFLFARPFDDRRPAFRRNRDHGHRPSIEV